MLDIDMDIWYNIDYLDTIYLYLIKSAYSIDFYVYSVILTQPKSYLIMLRMLFYIEIALMIN